MESCFPKKSLTTLLIILSVISSATEPIGAARPAAADTEFVRRSCSRTIYPALCFSTLSSHAGVIRQNPKLLASAALSVSLEATRSAAAAVVRLAHGGGLSRREAAAMRDCVEELSDSVDRLKDSVAQMSQIGLQGSDFGKTMSDVQTWVSAAMTDEDTCMDGFAGKAVNGEAKAAVRVRIVDVVHVTSNALALVNIYAALHG